MTMKPEFVNDAVWHGLPDEVQETVLNDGALLFRQGMEPEEAFWATLEKQKSFIDQLYGIYNVGAPPKGIQWKAVRAEDDVKRQVALSALIRGHYLATHGHDEFLKMNDAPALFEFLVADRKRHRCPYCLDLMTDSDDSRVGGLRAHHRCKPKLETLAETFFDIIDDEFQKMRALDIDEESSAVEVEYPEFLSIFGGDD